MKTKHDAIKVMIGLLVLVIAFHFLVLVKIIPHDIAWGGRLQSDQEMYVFESISFLLNLFLIWILALKSKRGKQKFVDVILWVFFGIFVLNSIGNLFAQTNFEKFFSIVTLLFALLLLRILWNKKSERSKE